MRKGYFTKFSIIHIHEEIVIVDEISRLLMILPFHEAPTRASEGPFRKKAVKFKVEVLDTPNF